MVDVMVEARGVEPLSENNSSRFSPGAGDFLGVCYRALIAETIGNIAYCAWHAFRRSVHTFPTIPRPSFGPPDFRTERAAFTPPEL